MVSFCGKKKFYLDGAEPQAQAADVKRVTDDSLWSFYYFFCLPLQSIQAGCRLHTEKEDGVGPD